MHMKNRSKSKLWLWQEIGGGWAKLWQDGRFSVSNEWLFI